MNYDTESLYKLIVKDEPMLNIAKLFRDLPKFEATVKLFTERYYEAHQVHEETRVKFDCVDWSQLQEELTKFN